MDGALSETKELAYSLFTRRGAMKEEYINHPVKRSTGAWGRELEGDPFLLIANLHVAKPFRRRGRGKRMLQSVMRKAQKQARYYKYATVLGSFQTRSMSEKSTPSSQQEGQVISERFLRALGYRRIGSSEYFAFAKDSTHPSRSLSSSDDYQRPLALRCPPWDIN